jgi:hypothetical protein
MIDLIKSRGRNNIKNKLVFNSGFTLFVAMIVSSLLLAVGFSIGNIIFKQLLLSGSGKDSQIAFYAADSGAECAQFIDTKDPSTGYALVADGPFATSTTDMSAVANCGIFATSSKTTDGINTATTTLVIDYSDTDQNYKACALVKIEKGFADVMVDSATTSLPYTKITSRGYNAVHTSGSTPTCDVSSLRNVERGLYEQY